MTSKRLLLAALCAMSGCFAGPITVVSATASSTSPGPYYDALHLIDGSGLSGGLHDNYFGNMWLSNGSATATLDFDLGGIYTLDQAFVWNYNWDVMLNRGTRTLTILVSINGIDYSTVGDYSLTRGTDAGIPADELALTGSTGRYVRFDLKTNYGDSDYIGLSEVRFDGSAAAPEPASALLVLFGLAGGAALGIRRRWGR